MQVKSTKDGSVYKFIHDDLSETAIKDVPTCVGDQKEQGIDKYTIFSSCSYGCKRACKFCMLHTKGVSYKDLPSETVLSNLQESLSHVINERPDFRRKSLKLSWMGMGEAACDYAPILESREFVEWALSRGYAETFDRIDIGSSLPNNSGSTLYALWSFLTREIEESSILKSRLVSTPSVRLFLSIGSLISDTRAFLMGSGDFAKAVDELRLKWKMPDESLICHLVLLDGVNDSLRDIEFLWQFFSKRPDLELRFLRYNQCEGSPYAESPLFDMVTQRALRDLPRVKVQISPGSEVMAACGQFLV